MWTSAPQSDLSSLCADQLLQEVLRLKSTKSQRHIQSNTDMRDVCTTHRSDPYVFESEDVVRGESRPLSELLLVMSALSSAAAAIDISRSSSGNEYKNTQSD